jgi:hypothetical protein
MGLPIPPRWRDGRIAFVRDAPNLLRLVHRALSSGTAARQLPSASAS